MAALGALPAWPADPDSATGRDSTAGLADSVADLGGSSADLADSLAMAAIDANTVAAAEPLIDITFTPAERDSLLEIVRERIRDFRRLRSLVLPNGLVPAWRFDPLRGGAPAALLASGRAADTASGRTGARGQSGGARRARPASEVEVPEDREALAFYTVGELAELVRTRRVTSLELTQLYLDRLRRFGPQLECVVTLTEDLALEQARRADEQIAAGRYLGPLHGIPYGLKDLFAVPGYPTTWGAEPYRDQVLTETATVERKLEEAGAVLVAKLSLGALAWGDVWFGGQTRNPWDPEQGSSGSSAGPAAATSAGLVGFAIGTETWGSIVSPCARCGVTGLRPTFGRVSRAGAMALSWSMDKIGPIARCADDCALVLEAIIGPDGLDPTVVDRRFDDPGEISLADLRVGYTRALFEEDYPGRDQDRAALDVLRGLGARLIPIDLPDRAVGALAFILEAEAAAAFDDLTRSGRDDLLVRQIKWAWPNVFRAARLIPAVEYIQATRTRTLLVQDMEALMAGLDVYLAPSFGGDNLLLTNLTGHPCVVVPDGFDEDGHPTSISFIGRLFDEGTLLAVARAFQEATDFHRQHPEAFR